jgi:hypothetical protein
MESKTEKTYRVKITKTYSRQNREDSERIVEGTLDYLKKDYFGYTLEVGKSWNKKINIDPKTISSFITNLQNSYSEKESDSYDRTFVELLK